ncbi:aldehyde dehydrogenase family protein [Photobacterium atrarenae]|uniref:Aldehyde dehydrogenase family protein n=1 Tax=Photobacterium atrarenae TaxID=865757 RepID=A0ABY5GML6_9GAMM|nr:aldehyde dehydrogenase family protein [Photobacterium atrarenae]UTV29548.1 aldehyde dehydrogenase family protein [Photobacterium atrarenae]
MEQTLAQAKQWAQEWLGKEKQQYVGGKWVSGSVEQAWNIIDPSNQQVLCSMALASEQLVEETAQIANACHQSGVWQETSRTERANILRQIAQLIRENTEKLAVLETLPNGKLIGESLADDIPTCADIFDYYAGWTDKYYGETSPVDKDYLNFTSQEPVGACALIAPWNFPLYQAALKLAPALAMGNTVILKPSEFTPLTAIYLFELIDAHLDLPAGVLNLLVADGKASNHLTLSDHIHKVSFTGSTPVGRKIIQNSGASNLKATTLELGGKSPCIFFADTPDLDKAIDRAFTVMFSHKGEKCSEPTRFLIQESIYDQVVEKLIAKAEAIQCGNPFDEASQQGPQCNQAQFDKIMQYIEIGKQEAELVAGGYRDTTGDNAEGLYIRPTIFSRVSPTTRIAQEEIFGPVLCCIAFETEQEAIEIANATPYGLAAGVYTSDVKRAHRMANKIDAGMFFINRYGCYGLSSPFGGFRQSGWGKEMAIHSLSSYTKTKCIWVYHGDD